MLVRNKINVDTLLGSVLMIAAIPQNSNSRVLVLKSALAPRR